MTKSLFSVSNRVITVVLTSLLIASCGGGGSSSGAVESTLPGSNTPASFVGVYTGVLNLRAEALGLSETDSVPITITVQSDGTIRFDGGDETFTVGVTDNGSFSGNIQINEDPCVGAVGVVGTVNGSVASGTVQGEGTCVDNGLSIGVDLSGDFNATK